MSKRPKCFLSFDFSSFAARVSWSAYRTTWSAGTAALVIRGLLLRGYGRPALLAGARADETASACRMQPTDGCAGARPAVQDGQRPDAQRERRVARRAGGDEAQRLVRAQRVDRRGHRLEADDVVVGRGEDLRVRVAGLEVDVDGGGRRRVDGEARRVAQDREQVVVGALAEREALGRVRRARAGRQPALVEREVRQRRQLDLPRRARRARGREVRVEAEGERDRRRRPSRDHGGLDAQRVASVSAIAQLDAVGEREDRAAARGARSSRARRRATRRRASAPAPAASQGTGARARRGSAGRVRRRARRARRVQRRPPVRRPRSPRRRAGWPTDTAAGSRTSCRARGRRRARRARPSSSSPRWRSEQPTIPAPAAKRASRSPPGTASVVMLQVGRGGVADGGHGADCPADARAARARNV